MYHSFSKETTGEFILTGKCVFLCSDSGTMYTDV
jgi:hypothetical protein